MDGLTASEWRNVLLADGAVLVAGFTVTWLLWHYAAPKIAAAVAVALCCPLVVGAMFLISEWKEDEGCFFLCFSAYESHWVGWAIGWGFAGVIVVVTLVAGGWSLLRRRRQLSIGN